MWQDIVVAVLAFGIIVIGGLGSILPILPGPPLSFAGLWLYAWWTGYETVTPTVLVVFGVLTALTLVTDVLAPALGARGRQASQWGVWGSVIGAFAGIFAMGPLGIIVGPFLGALAGEFYHSRNLDQSARVAWGSFLGFALGSLFKLAVITGMLAYLIYAFFQ